MFQLPELPYGYDALSPSMSSETLRLHHDKHHAAYVNKVNQLAKGGGYDDLPLEQLIVRAKERDATALFNNAAQAWNHAFFWESMAPTSAAPQGELMSAIEASFGSLSGLKEAFIEEGIGHFGSGWVWLVRGENGALEVISTHDAGTIITRDSHDPLLVCDLWEHAYYVDWRNDRGAYLKGWFETLANWSFAAKQFEARGNPAQAYRFPGQLVAHT